MDNKILIQELVKNNLLESNAGTKILQEASLIRRPVEELIYERRMVGEKELARIKSKALGIPYKDVESKDIDEDLLKIFPEETARSYKTIPLSLKDNLLIVGMINPDDQTAQEAVKFVAKQKRVNLGVYLISQSVWEDVLKKYSPYRSLIDEATKALSSVYKDTSQFVQLEEKMKGSDEAPIIKIVSSTLKEAIWEKASDIHIEPQRNRLRIRFRINGELQESASLPLDLHQAIVSRVKILSNLKIDENRIPQDGRFRTILSGRDIDFRVATFPTPVGEKVVIRVLDPLVGLRGLEELGISGKNLEIVKEGIKKPYGMILLTGPTGSGKTTTLYAMMQLLNNESVNIVSLEDPVEYFIDGMNQSQVKPEIGYDFASGLRQILRQDPDVIMVGEIRDDETAGLAVHAALTGHIVLSTLHTNNSIGVIPRLIDLKVKAFLLPSSLNLMVAQRLLPKLCDNCKKPEKAPEEISKIIEREIGKISKEILEKSKVEISKPYKIYKAPGCEVCKGKGVSGRVAIFEILIMTPELEEVINSSLTEIKILDEFRRQGNVNLRQDGILKALQGLISIEEVLRETEEV